MVDTYFALNPVENWSSFLEVDQEILTYPSNSRNSPNNTVNGESTEEAKLKDKNLIKKEEESEIVSSQGESEEDLNYKNKSQLQKSKRIQKREKAKHRQQQIKQEKVGQVKIECSEQSSFENIEFISSKQKELEELGQLLNETTDKKMKQKIRNRISAQNSRDKKKAYIQYLEAQNKQLNLKISSLIQDKQELEITYTHILEQYQQIKESSIKCPNCNYNFQESKEYENVSVLEENEGFNIFHPSVSNTNYGKLLLAGFGLFMVIGVLSFAAIGPNTTITQLNQMNNFSQLNDPNPVEVTVGQNEFENLNAFDTDIEEKLKVEDIQIIVAPQNQYISQKSETYSTAIAPIQKDYNFSEFINFKDSKKISFQTKHLFFEYYYQLLQIEKYRTDAQFYLNEVENSAKQEKIRVEFPNNKKFLSKEQSFQTEQQTTKIENALVSYYVEKNRFSTVFCPQPFLYEDSQQVFQNSQKMLQNSQYLHLLMPKDQIQQFAIGYNEQLIIDPYIENMKASFYQSDYQNSTQSKTKMIEIVCKIQYMKEI